MFLRRLNKLLAPLTAYDFTMADNFQLSASPPIVRVQFIDNVKKLRWLLSNNNQWLFSLEYSDISLLVDLFKIIVEGRSVIGLSESECINIISDAHLLAFKVTNIGKKEKL